MKLRLEFFSLVGCLLATIGCGEAPTAEPPGSSPSPGASGNVGSSSRTALLCELLAGATTFEQVVQRLGSAHHLEMDGGNVSLVYPYHSPDPGRREEVILTFSRTSDRERAPAFRLETILVRSLQVDGSPSSTRILQCAADNGMDVQSTGDACREGFDPESCPKGWVCSGGRCVPERLPPVSGCAKNICPLEPMF